MKIKELRPEIIISQQYLQAWAVCQFVERNNLGKAPREWLLAVADHGLAVSNVRFNEGGSSSVTDGMSTLRMMAADVDTLIGRSETLRSVLTDVYVGGLRERDDTIVWDLQESMKRAVVPTESLAALISCGMVDAEKGNERAAREAVKLIVNKFVWRLYNERGLKKHCL